MVQHQQEANKALARPLHSHQTSEGGPTEAALWLLFLDGRRFNLREPRRSLLCQGFRGHSPNTYIHTQRGSPWEVNKRVLLAER